MKLGLGTVQFGLDYGINNMGGKPRFSVVKAIINAALNYKISLLDTASDYGNSEEIIGMLASRTDFDIVTKISKVKNVSESLTSSYNRISVSQLYGVLIHDFAQFKNNPIIWEDLLKIKSQGLVTKIGFSLYYPEELEIISQKKITFDLIQIPYSVFDQRFEPYIKLLKNAGIEIHVRSVFLQGLVFKNPNKLSTFFSPIMPKLNGLAQISHDTNRSIESLCLNFVNSNPYIDKVIIGVDSESILERSVEVLNDGITIEQMQLLKNLNIENEQMILPFNWKV